MSGGNSEPRSNSTDTEVTKSIEDLREIAKTLDAPSGWGIAGVIARGAALALEQQQAEIKRLNGIYESAVKGRGEFRQSYRNALDLLRKFRASWEGEPGHENMDRLSELARNFDGGVLESLQPEMLEVLREAEDALKNCYDVTSYPGNGKSVQDTALRLVRETIAAAEGRS